MSLTLKYNRHRKTTKFQLTPKVQQSMENVHIDVFKIKTTIYLTIIDTFSKFAQAIEIKSKTPTEIVQALVKLFSIFGIPCKLIFDNGLEFKNECVNELLKLCKIKSHIITPVNPSSNGIIERFDSTPIEHFRLVDSCKSSVVQNNLMHLAILHYNNSINELTKLTPFEILFGHLKNK